MPNRSLKVFFVFLSILLIFSCVSSKAYEYSRSKRYLNQKRYQLFSSYAAVMGDIGQVIPGHSEAKRFERNMRLYERKFSRILTRRMQSPPKNVAWAAPSLKIDKNQTEAIRNFLIHNVSGTRMPLSFYATRDYWKNLNESVSLVETVLERTLVTNSLNIYDGAVWQIALAAYPSAQSLALVDLHTERLASGKAGDIYDLKAYGPSFRYGDSEMMMDRDGSYFFRMISDQYLQEDPLGKNEVHGFPNNDRVHHEDWKPITGEQAWAAIIGPLQVAYLKYGDEIPMDCPEMNLALSSIEALGLMQGPLGALYHAPRGTFGVHPGLISTENNFSVYAALKMLKPILEKNNLPEAEVVSKILEGLEKFFIHHAYDKKSHAFLAAGFYVEGRWVPSRLFASDCQTWAILALGPDWIDTHLGAGEAYRMWQTLIRLSGRRDKNGFLEGIGFTSDQAVTSVEWTCGAILAGRLLERFYQKSHPDWAASVHEEITQMRAGIEKYKEVLPKNKGLAYWYSSDRYFIPFGWWANPIPSLCASSWVILVDVDFNPFILGGGSR